MSITLEMVDNSAKIFPVMTYIPNAHVVLLHNATTGTILFLGRQQIADNPWLYDSAVATGAVAVTFFAVTHRVAEGVTGGCGEFSWCPFDRAELRGLFQSWVSDLAGDDETPL